ncbi:hypothetical protein B0H16DRAFT_918608 [Mycena metata]|uniref:DUF7029 domain-containing protein n=1 Tax=Mycena metata TaxID=1033252 RepID=A0AAD7IPQ0_9AGAR|nr:hypothetical protein B0H16DRAFT_918608 [Mycena metata]
MNYSYLVLTLAFFVKTVFAFTHAETHVPSPHLPLTLHPGIHPEDLLSDLENLKAKNTNSLYYASRQSSPVHGATIIQVNHVLPAVLLERSGFVASVTCDITARTISVTFADKESFSAALKDWRSHHGGFFLVSYVPNCGLGTESLERSFHLVSGVSSDEPYLRIVCHAKMVPIHETVHPDEEITIHAATFALEGPQPAATMDERVTRNRARGPAFVDDAVDFFGNFLPTVRLGRFVAKQIPFNTRKSSQGSFNTQSIKAYDGTFSTTNDSYLLAHFTPPKSNKVGPADAGTNTTNSTSTTEKYMDILCVNCGVDVKVVYSAHLVGTFVSGFQTAELKVQANVTVTLVLGIKATIRYEDEKNLPTIQGPVPYANLLVPNILEIGAFVLLDIGVTYSIDLTGTIQAGFICSWTGVGVLLDLKSPSKSGLLGDWGVSGHCNRVLDAELKLTVEVEPFAKLSLQVKATVLPKVTDKLTGDAALVERVGIKLTASVSTSKNGECPPGDPRMQGVVSSQMSLAGSHFDDISLHTPFEYTVFDKCLRIPGLFDGIEDARPKPTDNGVYKIPKKPPPYVGGYNTGYNGGGKKFGGKGGFGRRDANSATPAGGAELTSILWVDESQVVTPSNGSVVTRNSTDTPMWRSQKQVVVQTAAGESLCVASATLKDVGYARLEVIMTVPTDYVQIALGYPSGRTDYLLATDTKNAYEIVICVLNGVGNLYIARFPTEPAKDTAAGADIPKTLCDGANPEYGTPYLTLSTAT